MSNFNLKKFLTENKLTTLSKSQTVAEAKFPSFKDTDDGKVVDALTKQVYYDDGETPEFKKLMDRAIKEPHVTAAFGKWLRSNKIGRKDLGDIGAIKRAFQKFKQDVEKGSDEEVKNRVTAIDYWSGDSDNDWNSVVKDLANRALPKSAPPPLPPKPGNKRQGPPPLPPKPGQKRQGPPPLPPKPGQ